MKVAINGTGYVGLTTGAAFAYLGHDVVCLDIDESKIEQLQRGEPTIYEPGLEELIALANGHMQFSTDPSEMADAEVIFIAVGTPPMSDGNPDLTAVQEAARAVGEHMDRDFTVVVNKSTVPIGSGKWVEALIRDALGENAGKPFSVCSNPEFLREGSAIGDILYPDRVVVGSDDKRASEVLYTLYRPILEQNFPAPSFLPRPDGLSAVPLISTDIASAELIKYASNAFLSMKISFINEVGQLAEKVGADVTQIAKGIGLDQRIGSRFLQSGIGWGGSCFGKDSAALIATAADYGLRMPLVQAAREVNYRQRDRVIEKLLDELKILKGRTVGLLGLAFKPNTDDLRDAPALDIAHRLIDRGVRVKVHDPVALDHAKRLFADKGMVFCENAEQVLEESDAIILATDWAEYRGLPWKRLAKTMANPLVLDGRNFLDRDRLQRAGFRYLALGRG